jgi:ribosome-binding protein aMBF1 (putative translation factor)
MLTYEEFKAKALQDPVVRAEYERLNREEGPMLDAILKARADAGLTQEQVAQRMGTKASAVARLESALISGTPSPSLATLRKYASAMGKRVQVQFV